MRTAYIMPAFIQGWTKNWKPPVSDDRLFALDVPDLFKATVIHESEGRVKESFNRMIAEGFGEIVTQVKVFPTEGGKQWIILDKHTKKLLHKDVKNENDVEALCKKHGYVR